MDGLGRGIVVAPGAEPPAEFATAARVLVDDLSSVDELHHAWLTRQPVVVDLRLDPDELRAPEVEEREPWELGDTFELRRDRLQFLVWANNWDGRRHPPVWWWSRKAARLGGEARDGDVVLPDGRAVPVDGGPRGSIAGVVHRESIECGVLRVSAPAARAGHGASSHSGGGEPAPVLAPDQLAAVEHDCGPARIVAPAGSGKTRVLTERLRHLLDGRGWEPSTVTAVAFNKRAADELLARTDGLGAHVRTINALGLAVLTGALGGPRRRLNVIDEPEVRRILEPLVDVRPQANTDVLAPYIEALSAIRIGLRDPSEVEAAFPDAVGVTTVWPAYHDALERRGAIDFDDQITEAIKVLLRQPDIRAAAQQRCRHLLVDEFQDLAPAHLLLLRTLAAPVYDVFGVGDDDQVIYGYAGATPSYLIDFDRWFPRATTHALEVNYRCPVRVVDGARQLLSYNQRRVPKVVRTPSTATEGELRVRANPAESMAAAVADEIAAALVAGRSPGEVAVLSRVNSALLPVQVALGVAGVPATAPLDRRVLNRTGVRTALAWLRLGVDPSHIARADVLETIRRPSRRISRNVVEMLTKRARTSTADIRRLADRLSGGDVEKLLGYAGDIDAVGRARTTAAALAVIRQTVGLGQAMDTLDGSRASADRSSHGDDLRALEMVAALHEEPATFGQWLEAQLERRSTEVDAVTLSTVHRVKGQEWPLVIVFGAHADAFPHRLATDMEEERRVFHVAITRASATALVLADAAQPSPFVAELDGTRPRTSVRQRVQRDASVITSVAPPVSSPAEPALWDALKAWRRETAERSRVPAYVVLSDADMRGIADRRPSTLEELRRCRGMGPTRLERYGDELLAVLEAAKGK